jgi:hypothetical protein
MPINIYNADNSERVIWLCDDDWELPSQIRVLENWLSENINSVPSGNYVADVGFGIRKDACGGGAVLSVTTMNNMVKLGMKLYLSEYPDGE